MKLRKLISDQNKISFCNQLLEKIEMFGLGSFSKADTDALIYHLVDINKNDDLIKSNYDWMRLFKVTPTKLRSLQLIASVKYLNLEDSQENWILLGKSITKKRIEIDDANKGTVRFFIDNTHVQRFIEKFAVDNGSSLDYRRNAGQIVLKYGIFLDLITRLKGKLEIDEDELFKGIEKDSSFKEIQEVFNSPRQIFEDFKEKFKDRAFDEIASTAIKLVSTFVIKYVKSKISSK